MNRILNLLAFVLFCSSLFMRSVDPVIPQIAGDLGVEPSTAALLSTAYALPFAMVQPVLGALADMLSKSRLILLCLALVVVATFAGALVTSYEWMVVTRVVAGIGAGGLVPIGFAFVGDLVPVQDRQVALGRILFALMTGSVLGATCSGVIADLAGWRAVFVAMAVLGAIVLAIAVPGFRRLDVKTQAPATGFDLSTMLPNYRAIFSNPLAKFCFGAVAVEGAFMYGLFPHMASLLQSGGETRASIAGVVIAGFGIGGIVYSLRVSWLLNTFGERWMMRLGGLLMGGCVGFIALRAPWPVDTADFALLGLSFYMLHAVIQVYASELAPSARGSAMALHSFAFFIGQAAGPAFYSAGFAAAGVTPTILFGAAMLVLNGFVCGHYLRRDAATPATTRG